MIELPLIFAGGVLGSSHCIGMCGPFAVSVGAGARGWRNNLARQSVYSAGRIFTYTAGGAVAGYFGMRATNELPGVVPWQAVLAVVAGVLLVLQGISSGGWLRRKGTGSEPLRAKPSEKARREVPVPLRSIVVPERDSLRDSHRTGLQIVPPNANTATPPCMANSFFAPLLTAPGMRHPFLAGMLTGLLPCGLVYAFLALAAASGDMFTGMLTMAAFGLGTVPVMVLTGSGALMLKLAARRQLFRLAAICVIITGLVTIARGVAFFERGEAAVAGHNHMVEH